METALIVYDIVWRCILSPENICFWGARSRNISTYIMFVGTFGGLAPLPQYQKAGYATALTYPPANFKPLSIAITGSHCCFLVMIEIVDQFNDVTWDPIFAIVFHIWEWHTQSNALL